MISSCDPLLSHNIFPPPQQYIVFSYSWFSQLQRPALLKTAESAEAPLALTCSVLDEKQAMQSTEAKQREGPREWGRERGVIDAKKEEGREEDKGVCWSIELLQTGGSVDKDTL